MQFNFKKGIYKLNNQANFDFQLNRLIMWDGGDLDEVRAVSHKINGSESWKRELIALGDKALAEKRIENAIAYYRMSEFFMYDGDPDKKKYYKKACDLFYDFYKAYFESGEVKRFDVPYENITLPVMYAPAKGKCKDRIVLHGGNDSYFEELFIPMLYFADKGFDVYLFEGPGQGGVVRLQNKHFTHEWEKPVAAVLDYFNLSGVTIIGASLGGMLAPRAAAFEKRIERVIAWSVFPSFIDILLSSLPAGRRRMLQLCLRFKLKGLLNAALKKAAQKDELTRWGLSHGMYAYEAETPYEYAKKMERYQMLDVAHNITQDILIAGASCDHFIDYTLVGKEIAALKNVRSLTFRLFTEAESASNHCNCGNTRLVLDYFVQWIERTKTDRT